MSIQYVKPFTTTLRKQNGDRISTLLWGDPIHVLSVSGDRANVRARGRYGYLSTDDLTDKSLLEIYIIDVGQGDGLLMRTPDDKWHLIDAGVSNRSQMTKKGTANFLRWKFLRDLRRAKVELENVIISHPDYDHYGGMIDVLSGKLFDGRTFEIEAKNFYHPGMGRFASGAKLGQTEKSSVAPFPQGYNGIRQRGTFITELLSDKNSFQNPVRPFAYPFDELAELVGTVPQNVNRLASKDEFLPGYEPGVGDVTIHVLGPVVEQLTNGSEGLRWLSSQSKTRNGHSVVLRVELGNARILLTGDLNTKSQKLLLSYFDETEFESDVAKGCHHGSEDVHLGFIKAMKARATVISSGDNESYAHPRPLIIGASAHYGREAVSEDGDVIPPLLYSTELARSTKLAYVSRGRTRENQNESWDYFDSDEAQLRPNESGATYENLEYLPVSTDLIYGLVNVRTDGEHILMATMTETGNSFDVKVIKAGQDA